MRNMTHVYELRDQQGNVVDVGMSKQLKVRLRQHTFTKPTDANNGSGKWYGRKDLSIHSMSIWATRSEARAEEGRLKLHHGFKWTEQIASQKGGKLLGQSNRKLTMEQAQEIKSKYIPYKYTYHRLAKEYGVAVSAIRAIVHNQTYLEPKLNKL